jgi:hypothetical protein
LDRLRIYRLVHFKWVHIKTPLSFGSI